jgi:AcrR family transcriptional regulator
MTIDAQRRAPLSRERVLSAAIGIADESGVASLTMRKLAERLDSEAMSLYYHVSNKEDVLDGVVDAITQEINEAVAGIDPPASPELWKPAARRRILRAREVFLKHPWAPAVFATRTTQSMQVMRYYDGLVGLMRAGGFSNDVIHHALHALGSRALGFTQELFDPGNGQAPDQDALAAMAEHLPHLVGMLAEVAHDDPGSTLGWCDDQTEFEFGLDIVLDGLDRLR